MWLLGHMPALTTRVLFPLSRMTEEKAEGVIDKWDIYDFMSALVFEF